MRCLIADNLMCDMYIGVDTAGALVYKVENIAEEGRLQFRFKLSASPDKGTSLADIVVR
jgi:hypothetical protein